MDIQGQHLLLLGDQSIDGLSAVKGLVNKAKTIPAAAQWLREATDAIQIELRRLAGGLREGVPEFQSLLELSQSHHDSKTTNMIVSTVLMFVVRLGEVIV